MAKVRNESEGKLLTQIYVMLSENTEMTKKMHKVIYEGNGKPSLLSRADAIETHISTCVAPKLNEKLNKLEVRLAAWGGGGMVISFFAAYFLKQLGIL